MQLRQDQRLASSRAEHDAVMRAHMLNAASALDSYIADQDLAASASAISTGHPVRVLE